MTAPARWADAAQIEAAVRRKWNDGTLPRVWALEQEFPAVEVPLPGPSARQIGEDAAAARAWATRLQRASRGGAAYTIITGQTGGRLIGATEIPVRAVVTRFDQVWKLLGCEEDAASFRGIVQSTSEPALRDWALAHPSQAIAAADEWEPIRAAYRWLADHRGSGLYVRQVSASGVDTKLIERHRSILAAALEVPTRFLERELGLATKPATVRCRFDPAVFGMPTGLTEATLRTAELSALDARLSRAIIVENEITYLSLPVPSGGVVLWGKGYDSREAASLSWLRGVPTDYWGDIDTHGFAILNRARAHLPQVRSVLMDRQTLLVHRDRWGSEPTPTSAALDLLDDAEAALYADLVTDRYGPSVRLEQERIDWGWAMERLGLA